jgi:hypothetical protein
MLPAHCDAGGPEFSYSSCMNQGEAQGSMEGAFSFAPGNLTNPSGPDFEAQVRAEAGLRLSVICHANQCFVSKSAAVFNGLNGDLRCFLQCSPFQLVVPSFIF